MNGFEKDLVNLRYRCEQFYQFLLGKVDEVEFQRAREFQNKYWYLSALIIYNRLWEQYNERNSRLHDC